MEIRDYLRAIRRVLWLVIAIPVVAALATGGLIEIQPSAYQADASVVVPAISAGGFSQSAASQYVDTFKDVLVSQPVLNDVSQKFGIPTSELANGLSASTVTASSNIIHIVLVGKAHQNLQGAVHEATVDSLNAIAQPRLAQAQNAVAQAETGLQKANANYNAFVETTGNANPPTEFNNALTRLNVEEGILASAQLNHDAPHVAAANALIAQINAQLKVLGAQDVQYQTLNDALSAARSTSDHANQELVDAQALVATDEAPGTVTTVPVVRLSKLGNTIKFAGIAFALALMMMLGLILILELMRAGRRSAADPAPEQEAFAWGAEPATVVPMSAAASVRAPAMQSPTSATARDPWRVSPSATAVLPTLGGDGHTNGNGHANGNGNGHTNGNGNTNGNGHSVDVEGDPQRAEGGLLRRR